mgnify:CR=1 FL=1
MGMQSTLRKHRLGPNLLGKQTRMGKKITLVLRLWLTERWEWVRMSRMWRGKSTEAGTWLQWNYTNNFTTAGNSPPISLQSQLFQSTTSPLHLSTPPVGYLHTIRSESLHTTNNHNFKYTTKVYSKPLQTTRRSPTLCVNEERKGKRNRTLFLFCHFPNLWSRLSIWHFPREF